MKLESIKRTPVFLPGSSSLACICFSSTIDAASFVTHKECLIASQQAEDQLREREQAQDQGSTGTRFGKPVNGGDVTKVAEASIPPAARRKMAWAERVWSAWCAHRNMDNVPEPMKPFFKMPIAEVGNVELLWMLQRFVLEVRNEKGGNYPADTLYELCTSLQKVVNDRGNRVVSFFSFYEFQTFKDVLDSEMKRLRKLGFGVVRRQAQALSNNEEEQLWSSGVLGSSTPKQLLNTVFFFAGKHFALRSGDEHRSLRAGESGQMSISTDKQSGRRCVEYVEDVS